MVWHPECPNSPSTSLAALSEFSLLTLLQHWTPNVAITHSSILRPLLSSVSDVYLTLVHESFYLNTVESHIYVYSSGCSLQDIYTTVYLDI